MRDDRAASAVTVTNATAPVSVIRYGMAGPCHSAGEAAVMSMPQHPSRLWLLALAAPFAVFATRRPRPALDEANAQRDHRSPPTAAPAHQRLTLALDKAAVVQLDTDARDVLVSNPELVDAVVRTPRRIFLLATKVGQTNAFFFDAQGKQILSLDIRVEKDVVDLAGLMKASHAQFRHPGAGAERQCGADRLGRQRPGIHPRRRSGRHASPAIPRRSSTCSASPAASR